MARDVEVMRRSVRGYLLTDGGARGCRGCVIRGSRNSHCSISFDAHMAEFESNKKAKVDAVEPASALTRVLVKGIDGGVVDARELPLNTTAAELKALVSETTGLPISKILLALGGNPMGDTRSLAEHGIETEAEVEMLVDSHNLETDKAALITLYNSTNGAQWNRKRGWLTDAPVGEWDDVTVEGGRVTKVNLSYNNLSGAWEIEFACPL